MRDSIEHRLIAHDSECPWLLIYRARREYRCRNKTTDGFFVYGLIRVLSHRAATCNCLLDIHFVAPRKDSERSKCLMFSSLGRRALIQRKAAAPTSTHGRECPLGPPVTVGNGHHAATGGKRATVTLLS